MSHVLLKDGEELQFKGHAGVWAMDGTGARETCLPEVPLQINKSTVDCSSAVSGTSFTSVDIGELRGMAFHRLKQKHQSSEQLEKLAQSISLSQWGTTLTTAKGKILQCVTSQVAEEAWRSTQILTTRTQLQHQQLSQPQQSTTSRPVSDFTSCAPFSLICSWR